MSSTRKTSHAVQPPGGLRVENPVPGVRVLTIDRSTRRNSLDEKVFGALALEVDRVRTNPSVRALVLTGANGVFSAGADFDGLAELHGMDEVEGSALLASMMTVAERLWDLPQPTMAAIDGPAVGAGMSLALACDIRIGSPSMTLFPSFIRMGLLPDTGASWLLPRLIGESMALQLLLAGRPVDSARAQQLGLVTQLSDDPLAACIELASTFAARPPAAVTATKRLLRDVARGSLAQAIEKEGVAQSAAIHGEEFTTTFSAWRTSRRVD